MQQTLSIIKPEAVSRNVCGKIISMIEESGLKICAQKMLKLSIQEAAEFYSAHQGKAFFDGLVESLTSGPIVVQVLSGENAIEDYRKIMGNTNPVAAEEGTIRKLYGQSIEKNAVHGSDSEETAEREIAFFFNQLEILK